MSKRNINIENRYERQNKLEALGWTACLAIALKFLGRRREERVHEPRRINLRSKNQDLIAQNLKLKSAIQRWEANSALATANRNRKLQCVDSSP